MDLRKDHPATLLTGSLQLADEKPPGGCQPTGDKLLVWPWRGLSLRQWSEKQCGGAREGQGWMPFAFFLQHIYKVIKNVHNQKTQRHRESTCPHPTGEGGREKGRVPRMPQHPQQPPPEGHSRSLS